MWHMHSSCVHCTMVILIIRYLHEYVQCVMFVVRQTSAQRYSKSFMHFTNSLRMKLLTFNCLLCVGWMPMFVYIMVRELRVYVWQRTYIFIFTFCSIYYVEKYGPHYGCYCTAEQYFWPTLKMYINSIRWKIWMFSCKRGRDKERKRKIDIEREREPLRKYMRVSVVHNSEHTTDSIHT